MILLRKSLHFLNGFHFDIGLGLHFKAKAVLFVTVTSLVNVLDTFFVSFQFAKNTQTDVEILKRV